MSTRPIFRPSAVEAYRRGLERANVPRVMAWPSTVFFWVLLMALLLAVLVAWSVRIPTYVASSGVILTPPGRSVADHSTRSAVLFLEPDQSAGVRRGRRVHLDLGSSTEYVEGIVTHVAPRAIGPDAALQRYGVSHLITHPSVAVAIRLSRPLSIRLYGGSRVSARVETASERIISLLTG